MATDKNGTEIKEGDIVALECRVIGAYDGQGYAVAMLEPAVDCGGGVHTRTFGVNSKQVEKKSAGPDKPVSKQKAKEES